MSCCYGWFALVLACNTDRWSCASSEQHASSSARPVSDIQTSPSMYSQPTPDLRRQDPRFFGLPTDLPVTYEISPPSSPDARYPNQSVNVQRDRSVSPLGDAAERYEHRATRGVAVDHQVPPFMNYDAPPRFLGAGDGSGVSDRDSITTKWDDFTRESANTEPSRLHPPVPKIPTMSSALRNGFVEDQQRAPSGVQTGSSGADELTPRGSLHEPELNARSVQPRGDSDDSPTMVRLISQKPLPETEPIILPLKSSKRLSSLRTESPDSISPSLKRYPDLTIDTAHGEDIKPTVPLKAGRNSPARFSSSPVTLQPTGIDQRYAGSDDAISGTSSGRSSVGRPSNLSHESPSVQSTGTVHQGSTSTNEPELGSAMKNLNIQEQPVSRFNSTTYGQEQPVSRFSSTTYGQEQPVSRFSSTTYGQGQPVSRFSSTTYGTEFTYNSPPRTPVSSGGSTVSTPCVPQGMLNRRRPVLSFQESNVKATTRKPLSLRTDTNLFTSTSTPRSSTSKCLPLSPPEAQSEDLITTLQAQLDNLRHQRGNLQRIVLDLNRLLAPGPNSPDRHARADLKSTVDQCSSELDEIIRQEHEVGMRLHRAWRRREKEELCDEPTGLWVRRVTS